MIEITKKTKAELWPIGGIIYNIDDYQAQYIKEGIQFRDNKTGKDYLFAYNKVFSEILGEKDFMVNETGRAFIHWTRTDNDNAKRNRFKIKNYMKQGTTFNIEGYPFKREQITPLIDILIDEKEILIPFLLEYIRRFAEYRNIDENRDATINRPKKTKSIFEGKEGEQETLQDIKQTKTQKEGNKMTNKITNIASTTVDINKDAVKLAAKLEVGKVATQTIGKAVKKQLPMMVRGYADSPFYNIVIANMAGIALREFASNNEKAMLVSEAMIQSAAVEMMSSFNIDKMINDMLKDIDVSKLSEAKD